MGTRQHKFSIVASVALAVSGMIGASTAVAQPTRPSPAPATDNSPQGQTQIVSPYWNGSQGAGGNVRQTPTTPDDLMAATVLAVPGAHANAVEAELNFRRLNSQLNRSADTLRRDFLSSDEYTRAVNNLRAAHDEFDRARNEAISGIRETDEYRAAMSLHKDVSDQIAREREQDHPDPQRLVALAELKLGYVMPLRNVEREQIENSQDVRTAREHLRSAAAEVARLEGDFTKQARESIDLNTLRKSRDDARVAMLTANTYWLETRAARRIAVRYAYFSRALNYEVNRFGYSPYADDVFNRYTYGYGYGGYGYGYGYGGGYGGLAFYPH